MLCEGEAALDHGVGCGCIWWFHLKAGKEDVQLPCQRGLTLSSSRGRPVVGVMLDSLPHLPAIIALQMFLNPSTTWPF